MMLHVSKYHGSEIQDPEASIKDSATSVAFSSLSPTEKLKTSPDDNVEDLISCINTWQKNKGSGFKGNESDGPDVSGSHFGADLRFLVDNHQMRLPGAANRLWHVGCRKHHKDHVSHIVLDKKKVENAITDSEVVSTSSSLEEEKDAIHSVKAGRNKNIGGFEGLDDLNTTSDYLDIDDMRNSVKMGFKLDSRETMPRTFFEPSSAPTLQYLNSRECLGSDRLSDNEDNPFMTIGMDLDENAVITPRDIMAYGRNESFKSTVDDSFNYGTIQASKILKNISLNCQIDNIRSGNIPVRLRRHVKDKGERNTNVEEFAKMAAEFEKVRGVCYCRSDNSWTAWWTEKGRNRKKAFKVSRFGFEEARSRAIAHRLSIEEKVPELRAKHHIKDSVSDTSLDQEVTLVSPASSPEIPKSPVASAKTTSPSTKHATRMHTRNSGISGLDMKSTHSSTFINQRSALPKENIFEVEGFINASHIAPVHMVSSPTSFKRVSRPQEEDGVRTPELIMKDLVLAEETQTNMPTSDDIRKSIHGALSSDTATETPGQHYNSSASTPRDKVALNRDAIDQLSLDSESSHIIDIAMSNLAFGNRWSALSAGETVKILPDIMTDADGSKVTVIILRHK